MVNLLSKNHSWICKLKICCFHVFVLLFPNMIDSTRRCWRFFSCLLRAALFLTDQKDQWVVYSNPNCYSSFLKTLSWLISASIGFNTFSVIYTLHTFTLTPHNILLFALAILNSLARKVLLSWPFFLCLCRGARWLCPKYVEVDFTHDFWHVFWITFHQFPSPNFGGSSCFLSTM